MKASSRIVLFSLVPFLGILFWWKIQDSSKGLNSGSSQQSSVMSPQGDSSEVEVASSSQVGSQTWASQSDRKPSSATALKPDERTRVEKKVLQLLSLHSAQGSWRLTWGAHDLPTTISGGLLANVAQTSASALSFAQDLAEALGLPRNQVAEVSGRHLNGPQGSLEAYHFEQTYNGYTVDNAYLRIFLRPADGAAYFIANELKDLGPVDTQISLSLPQAQGKALGLFQTKSGVEVATFSREPVIYNLRPGASELVWRFEIKIEAPLYDRRLVLISAKQQGSVVLNRSLLKY